MFSKGFDIFLLAFISIILGLFANNGSVIAFSVLCLMWGILFLYLFFRTTNDIHRMKENIDSITELLIEKLWDEKDEDEE